MQQEVLVQAVDPRVMPTSGWSEQFESEMKKTIKELLNDPFVENKIGNFPIWSMISKTSKITFLNQNELQIFESYLEAMICRELMSLPPCTISDETLQLIGQVRMISKFNLRRSSGTENSNKINERTVQAMQIRQSFSTGGGMGGTSAKPGFLKRLFGMK